MLIEKYICDYCGKTMGSEQRRSVRIGIRTKKIEEELPGDRFVNITEIRKDICDECFQKFMKDIIEYEKQSYEETTLPKVNIIQFDAVYMG